MKKFLVLYKSPVEEFTKMMQGMTPEMRAEYKKEWGAWMENNKSVLVDMGAPVGKAKEVTATSITDIENDIGGYSVIQAETLEAAAAMLAHSPQLKLMEGSVEVMEFMPM